MSTTALVGVGLGLFALGVAGRAVATGTVTFVFARLLGGFGPTLSAEFDRDEHPTAFWACVVFYAAGGLLITALAGRALLRGGP